MDFYRPSFIRPFSRLDAREIKFDRPWGFQGRWPVFDWHNNLLFDRSGVVTSDKTETLRIEATSCGLRPLGPLLLLAPVSRVPCDRSHGARGENTRLALGLHFLACEWKCIFL